MATRPKRRAATRELSKQLADEQISASLKAVEEFKVHLARTQDAINTHEAGIKVMQAWLDGKTIQSALYIPNPEWTDNQNPTWDWLNYDYRVKPEPWRADHGARYYTIGCSALTVIATTDVRCEADDIRWEAGNYFKTQADALAAVDKIKAMLKDYREATRY